MTHIDLFSGIGGFAYAARQVWPDYHNLFFCDNNKFCQAVLRKNFGQDILIYDDIREVTVERFIADTELRGCSPKMQYNEMAREGTGAYSASNQFTVDLLTGGFPCQPFSVAGKREGRDDDRHLWPEMFRVIKAFVPRWVIAENVRGLINIENGMAFEQVCLDLESIGYTVQAFVIPACAVNAPHRRDRVWIVANASERQGRARRISGCGENKETSRSRAYGDADQPDRHAADASDQRLQWVPPTGNNGSDRTQPYDQRFGVGNHSWSEPWLEVATRLCRVDDGLPAGIHGLKLSKSKHREERLKALGNAIVPQLAAEIMRAIRETT
jgi:DNA (cytosine-5)-methyltransferase 1